jgi:hypothetical protein
MGEIETVDTKVGHLESHLKSVRDELTNTLQMRNNRKNELNTGEVLYTQKGRPAIGSNVVENG